MVSSSDKDGKTPKEPTNSGAETPHWTLHEAHHPRITRALAWAANTPAAETDLATVLAQAKHRKRP